MTRFKVITLILSFSFMALSAVTCRGQQEINAVFDNTEWDFGSIEELDGPVTHVFTLTNKSRKDIVITRVASSCGCAATQYDRAPVKFKNSASIEVRFDPRDFSGPVRKTVSVAVSDGKTQQSMELLIYADVIPRALTIEDEYPLVLDEGLRVSGLHAPFGYLQHGTVRTDTLKLYNGSDKDIRLGISNAAGTGLLKAEIPSTLKPQEKAFMTVTYDLRAAGSVYGMVSDRIILTINGKRSNLPVNANAIITDDFSGIDKETAPIMVLDPAYHSFGRITRDEKLSREITISNTGATPLIIRNVSARKNTGSDLKEGAVIKPGESITTTITMTVSKDTYGIISGGITIISNDPEKPMRELRIAAEVAD